MIALNKTVIDKVVDDKSFIDEVNELLNQLVEAELEKPEDEIDFDFIDECSNVIISIQSNAAFTEDKIISLLKDDKFLQRTKLIPKKGISTTFKVALIAAILLLSTITVNAAVEGITGENLLERVSVLQSDEETEETTTQAANDVVEEKTETTTKTETTKSEAISKNDKSVLVSKMQKPQGNGEGTYSYVEIGDSDEYPVKHKTYTKKGTAPSYKFEIESGGQEIDANYKNLVCSDGTKNHNWSDFDILSKATCNSDGTKVRQCYTCGQSEYWTLYATGKHKFGKEFVDFKAQSGASGQIGKKCSLCGRTYYAEIAAPKYIIFSNDTFYYDGATHKPTVKAVIDADGYEIPKDYYSVSYRNCQSVNDSSQIVIGFKGNYYENGAGCFISILPPATNLSGIAVDGNSIMPYWSKSSLISTNNCTGYEIEYSENSDFSNSTKVKARGSNTTSQLIKKLKSNTKYYVRVRTYYYYSDNYENKYSYWSDVRAVTTK